MMTPASASQQDDLFTTATAELRVLAYNESVPGPVLQVDRQPAR